MSKAQTFVGIDASFTAFGIAAVTVESPTSIKVVSETLKSAPAKDSPGERMGLLYNEIKAFVATVIELSEHPVRYAIEGFSFGSPFARESMGRVDAVARLAVWDRAGCECTTLTPGQVKQFVAPDWRLWTKAAWEAAGGTGTYKRKMPPKEEIMAALFRHFGIDLRNDAEADAVSVALLCAHRHGAIPNALLCKALRSQSKVDAKVPATNKQARPQTVASLVWGKDARADKAEGQGGVRGTPVAGQRPQSRGLGPRFQRRA